MSDRACDEIYPHMTCQWQEGYGVVTLGRRNLPFVPEYVRRRWERHPRGSVIERLEAVVLEADG